MRGRFRQNQVRHQVYHVLILHSTQNNIFKQTFISQRVDPIQVQITTLKPVEFVYILKFYCSPGESFVAQNVSKLSKIMFW